MHVQCSYSCVKLFVSTTVCLTLSVLPNLACGDGVDVGGAVEGDGGEGGGGEDGEERDAVAWRGGEGHEDGESEACDLKNKRYMLY